MRPGCAATTRGATPPPASRTDHECFTLDEALDKIACGMKILIREGSAARNYEALKSLLATHPESCMLCSDDKHPDDLLEGHIDGLVRRAVADGLPVMNVLRAACVHPVEHYGCRWGCCAWAIRPTLSWSTI